MNRAEFMSFFRDEAKLNQLTVDDRVEIFRTVLIGRSDFTKKLLDEILSDYDVEGLDVREVTKAHTYICPKLKFSGFYCTSYSYNIMEV